MVRHLAIGVVLASAIIAVAQESHWGDASDPTVKMIVASERTWAESNCAPQASLKDIIADDYQGTSPSGKRSTKADAITTDTNNLHRECTLEDVKVKFFGANLAMVYGSEYSLVKGGDGKEFKRCLVWTDTWLRRRGRWQIIAAQDTSVQCK